MYWWRYDTRKSIMNAFKFIKMPHSVTELSVMWKHYSSVRRWKNSTENWQQSNYVLSVNFKSFLISSTFCLSPLVQNILAPLALTQLLNTSETSNDLKKISIFLSALTCSTFSISILLCFTFSHPQSSSLISGVLSWQLTMWHDLREYEITVALRAQKKRDLMEISFLPFHLTHSTPTTRRDDDFFISYFHHALVPPLVEWLDCGHSASHPKQRQNVVKEMIEELGVLGG